MARSKVAVTMDASVLAELDCLVKRRLFANRSLAVEAAVREKLERMFKRRLAEECAKLDRAEEQLLAECGMAAAVSTWPEY